MDQVEKVLQCMKAQPKYLDSPELAIDFMQTIVEEINTEISALEQSSA